MGDPEFLRYIGAVYIKTDPQKERYNQLWELEGKKLFSNGKSIKIDGNESIYNINSLKKILDTVDFSNMEKLEKQHDYIYNKDIEHRYENYKYIMGWPRYLMESGYRFAKILESDDYKNLLPDGFLAKYIEESKKNSEIDLVSAEYMKLLSNDNFCKKLSDLSTLYMNMFVGSYLLKPFQNFLTPQCGEHRLHQTILVKFVNK